MKIKKRLDVYIQELYPHYSRTQIQSWIMQNKALVNGQVIAKPGTQVTDTDEVVFTLDLPKYVCRAGWKLEKALDYFEVDPKDLVILDAGLSTGGFTDCLLQRGAQKVYGIDVGYGQVHEKIRQDPRVIVKERTNLRYLEDVGERVDLITLDLSFISISKVMNAVCTLLKPAGKLITLIKPQFEAERHEIGKGGIIKDPEVHKRVVEQTIKSIESFGFDCQGVTESPIEGATGNKEFLGYFVKI
ncbi:TlyA family RNA methyltransferase [Candidatus Dependentiae bacterium]|nr:TlyA family RNA methyltransferase [Candidatus Dependentiae bacterium]